MLHGAMALEINLAQQRFLLAALLIFTVFISTSFAAEVADSNQVKSHAIPLPSRTLTPTPGIKTTTLQQLQRNIVEEQKSPHILLQFKGSPTRNERINLQARGVRLLSHISDNTWHASLSETTPLFFTDPVKLKQYPVLATIRWIGQVETQDKIHPVLKEAGPGPWATNPDGTIKVSINFYRDVTSKRAREILNNHEAVIESERSRRVSFYIVIEPNALDALAAEDSVESIELYPPPRIDSNNGSRAWTNTDAVHGEVAESDATINIEGNGVILGMWDTNEVDDAHHDLAGRVVYGEVPRTFTPWEHSTHVACTMAGNGTVNPARMGHAPQAPTIVSFDFLGDIAGETEQGIEDHNLVVINNSWNWPVGWRFSGGAWVYNNDFGLFGDYVAEASDFDELVRSEGVVIVQAAGNDRDDPADGSDTPARPADADQGTGNGGYDTIAPPASGKNIISVGAINDTNSAMYAESNWGPTDDGRIKPDVVAPGVGINSCDDDPDDGYTTYWGTSMAAPAVSGIAGLLIQTYRDEFFGDVDSEQTPLPSTIKALLIHSAQDLGNPGPDYQFGWGGVDAIAAYELMRERQFIESEFRDNGEQDLFVVDVPAGAPNLRVSMCWDDIAADHLVNDLDLSLVAPGGVEHFAWLLNPDPGHRDDNALTGLDHTNNCEQVFVNAPASGRWIIRADAFAVNEPVAAPEQHYSLVSSLPFYQEDSVSVVQVIDRSGSMSHRDEATEPSYMESAKVAAQNFIGLMHLGDEAGVVAFDDQGCDNVGAKAESVFGLVELNNEITRGNAIDSIDPLDDRGCTSIGAGMELAQDGPGFLDAASADQPHAMVLLTDGFENTPPWVRERPAEFGWQPATPDNVLDSIPIRTDVYTIALGPHADSALMQDIATTTGGKYYQAPTILGLLGIYYQIHGDVALAELTGLESGSKSGGNDTRSTLVDDGASEVTFVVGWLQAGGQLRLELETPDGNPLDLSLPGIESVSGNNHYYVRVKNPQAGSWQVRLLRLDQQAFAIDYTYAALINGASKFWSFVPEFSFAGECLIPQVRLFDKLTGQAITGATVKARVTSPQSSQYTLNYDYVVAQGYQWQKQQQGMMLKALVNRSTAAAQAMDAVSNWSANLLAYNQASLADTGQSIFQYDTFDKVLLDDGGHHDNGENDGVYANCIDSTHIAGGYNIRFEISGVTAAGLHFERAALAAATIRPEQVDVDNTFVAVKPAVIDVDEGSQGIVVIVPKDRFGNVWGPGHAARISVSTTQGSLLGGLQDNGDGFYIQSIVSTGTEGEGRVTVTVDDMEMAAKPEVRFGTVSTGVALSVHVGAAMPQGSFNSLYDSNYSLALDLDYHLNPQLSLVGTAGYDSFTAGSSAVSDTYWWRLTANAKYVITPGRLQPYVTAGIGAYFPENGSTEPGLNAGLGLDYSINSQLSFEAGVDYHFIFTGGSDTEYLTPHIGVLRRF